MSAFAIMAITLAIILVIYCETKQNLSNSLVENYGGVIRNVKKIPMTDCYKMCDRNGGQCQRMYPHDNVGKCFAQWESCRKECYFSNAQRM